MVEGRSESSSVHAGVDDGLELFVGYIGQNDVGFIVKHLLAEAQSFGLFGSFLRMNLSGREVDVDLSVGLVHVFRKVGGSP